MKNTQSMPHMLDKCRFNRRLYLIDDDIALLLLPMGHYLQEVAECKEFMLDAFPIPVCDHIRMSSSKLVQTAAYRGWQASMRSYSYGVKVELITTSGGLPVEFCLAPGG